MEKPFVILILGLVLGILIGLIVGSNWAVAVHRNIAIEHGAAYYNPTNAHFTWKEQR